MSSMQAKGKILLRLLHAGIVFLFAGCSGNQSSLNPAGEQARDISNLWWLYCVVLVAIYLAVFVFFLLAVFRNEPESSEPILNPDPKRERRLTVAVSAFVGVTIATLFVFL